MASLVVDGHYVGGGEGMEGGAVFEGVVGNRFNNRNTVQQRAVDENPIAERCEGLSWNLKQP